MIGGEITKILVILVRGERYDKKTSKGERYDKRKESIKPLSTQVGGASS